MEKKTLAVILEMIPVISAPLSCILIFSDHVPKIGRKLIPYFLLLAFLGFVFFLIGRKLYKEDEMVRILGILDCIATISVIGLYVLAIFSFGL